MPTQEDKDVASFYPSGAPFPLSPSMPALIGGLGKKTFKSYRENLGQKKSGNGLLSTSLPRMAVARGGAEAPRPTMLVLWSNHSRPDIFRIGTNGRADVKTRRLHLLDFIISTLDPNIDRHRLSIPGGWVPIFVICDTELFISKAVENSIYGPDPEWVPGLRRHPPGFEWIRHRPPRCRVASPEQRNITHVVQDGSAQKPPYYQEMCGGSRFDRDTKTCFFRSFRP